VVPSAPENRTRYVPAAATDMVCAISTPPADEAAKEPSSVPPGPYTSSAARSSRDEVTSIVSVWPALQHDGQFVHVADRRHGHVVSRRRLVNGRADTPGRHERRL